MPKAIVDDPGVLAAALSLADEWYAAAETADHVPPFAASSTAKRAGATHSREELAALRSSVRQLQHVLDRHWPTPRACARAANASTNAMGGRHAAGDAKAATRSKRAQARRVLDAIHAYNRLQTMTQLTLAVVERVTASPFDNERMIDTLRSRLDVLTHIATKNRIASITATNGTVQELSHSPTFTDVGLQIQSKTGHYVPFKLSLVAEAMWERTHAMIFGGSDEQNRRQLSCASQDEYFGFVGRTNETPFGLLSSSGPSALRRVYEDDGSVLFVYTSVKAAPPTKQGSSESENLFAGLTLKQATWTRARRVERSGNSALTRPLVHIELGACLTMETTSGRAISKDRILRVWNAIVAVSTQESRSRQSLENRLLDLSLEREKKESSKSLQ